MLTWCHSNALDGEQGSYGNKYFMFHILIHIQNKKNQFETNFLLEMSDYITQFHIKISFLIFS